MKKYSLAKLSTNIKKLRKEKKMTRDALATKAKVNYNTIIKLESGANKNPTIKTLIGIAQILETDVENLIV